MPFSTLSVSSPFSHSPPLQSFALPPPLYIHNPLPPLNSYYNSRSSFYFHPHLSQKSHPTPHPMWSMRPDHHSEFPNLPPIRTAAIPAAAGEDDVCTTPKSKDHVLKPPVTCPPAPRKPRPAKRKRMGPTPRSFCAVPRDLTSVFVAISIASSEKRIRVSWVSCSR